MAISIQLVLSSFLPLPLRGGTRQDAASPSRGRAATGREKRLPWCGKLGSMAWKNGENGFHGMEVFRKVASMAWKNGEFGFHGVEAPEWGRTAAGGGAKTTTPPAGGGRVVKF